MRKLVISALILVLLCNVFTVNAFAADAFDVSALSTSSRYQSDGDFWSIAADYVGIEGNYKIIVGSYLSSTYVANSWGPELRVICKRNNEDLEVTAFRATINGKTFRFENLAYNADPRMHAGYLFGGTVYEAFMNSLGGVKTASIQVDYKEPAGTIKTVSINHVHTGELSHLMSVAKYYRLANAFSTDEDPAWSDAFYGASET